MSNYPDDFDENQEFFPEEDYYLLPEEYDSYFNDDFMLKYGYANRECS